MLLLLLWDSGQVIKLAGHGKVCRSEKRRLRLSVCGELNITVMGGKANDFKSHSDVV